ncbi:MAG: RNA polymerase sigma factor [Actinomycetota bacterium]|nr:RNA polymerase sigma factor [Actinomycetota bacterium]
MSTHSFEQPLGEALAHLRGVLIARHGLEVGADLHAEVTEYAWEHRDRLRDLDNPVGYLYRVAQSRTRRYRRWNRAVTLPPERPAERPRDGQPAEHDVPLDAALARLHPDERTVVVLIHAYGYRYDEAAEFLGTSVSAVRNRLHRGMTTLRRLLNEETPDAHR